MAKPKWTPGPWSVSPNVTMVISGTTRHFAHGQVIASVSAGPGKNTVANAGLIAAAPDLYALLCEARLYVADAGGDEDPETQGHAADLVRDIDAVLAKARGEAP